LAAVAGAHCKNRIMLSSFFEKELARTFKAKEEDA
jgi:hypothetical protein